ncbi:response regulator transcription factor [Flavobacterium sp. C4GT6]|uniref:response regulator transcription factor n=1 Tax=Flavobacterium sp. C4GT6 TaxID=3103818 RepID=UPI002ED24659
MKILIVEDEKDLISGFLTFSEQEKISADVATTYQEASEKVYLYEYDCILLDINLPDASGLQLLEDLQKMDRNNGVIVVSARNSVTDKVKGLNLGADDYLTKPFHLSELSARIQAVIRRRKFDAPNLLCFGSLSIELNERKVVAGESLLNLTKKEYDILLHLIANKNRVITKNALAEYIWGDSIDNTDSFDFLFQHLKNLKKKLRQGQAAIQIRNIYGVGYQIAEI